MAAFLSPPSLLLSGYIIQYSEEHHKKMLGHRLAFITNSFLAIAMFSRYIITSYFFPHGIMSIISMISSLYHGKLLTPFWDAYIPKKDSSISLVDDERQARLVKDAKLIV